MHLASVTLRGFKSFAGRTHLEFDPGLVAVVGPNGSGKSNLIDALIWSLGTLSTRALRAERMEEVIFAGTMQRPALGMSQVLMTFDNSSGAFPVDLAEVQIGRTLYRDGASEYSLNGGPCRLLDVSDLLSEAGIGKELHAVVAQGQVDEIVGSSPEQLRGFVEEAAGISKHRRRAERAQRKIEQVEQDISRAADLLTEIRRQIRPLETQAGHAVRHREITDALREIRIRLLAGELEEIEAQRIQALEGRESAQQSLSELRTQAEHLRSSRNELQQGLDDARRESNSLRLGLDHLRAAQGALLRCVLIMREQRSSQTDAGRRVAAAAKLQAVESEQDQVRRELETLELEIETTRDGQSKLESEETAHAREAELIKAQLTTLSGKLTAAEVEARTAEQTTITSRAEAAAADQRFAGAGERISRLTQAADVLRNQIEQLDSESGQAGLTVSRLETEHRSASDAADAAGSKLRNIESRTAVLAGRLESLKVARDLKRSQSSDAEEFLKQHGTRLGIRGVLGSSIRVAPGMEKAVEAVAGDALVALVLGGAGLVEAIELAEAENRELGIVVTQASVDVGLAIAGAKQLSQFVECPAFLRPTVDSILRGAYLVEDAHQADALSKDYPHAAFVNSSGKTFCRARVSRPSKNVQPSIGLNDAIRVAEKSIAGLEADRSRWATSQDRSQRDLKRTRAEADVARAALQEIEGRIAAAADRLREVGAEIHGAELERDLAAGDRDGRLRRAEESAAERTELLIAISRLGAEQAQLALSQQDETARAKESESNRAAARDSLTERLTLLARLTERLSGLNRVAQELRPETSVRTKAHPPEQLARAEKILRRTELVVEQAQTRVRTILAHDEDIEAKLRAISTEAAHVEVEAVALEPRALRAAEVVARADAKAEEIGSRLARDFEIPPAAARAEFPLNGDREALRAEENRLDAELRSMGPVNPLAASELVELVRRKDFLESQIADLRGSRRDLGKLVRAAEERMRELLVSAVADVDTRFREVAALLFSEGSGRIRLSHGEDDDPLAGGIHIEVRLGRKGHRRLGLLSGGEKALAGLGFLFGLHLARPTPFLVLDEVDAALDDANLGRFLKLIDTLRTRTQIIVVTHQRRTMERADSLIGVTLNPDGTSAVVTQSMHDHVSTPV